MLNTRIFNRLIVSSLMTACLAQAETTTVKGGTVYFKGEVVSVACAVGAGSVGQTVQFGQIKTETLSEADKTSSAVGFSIQLNDFDLTVATKAAITFSAVAVNPTNLTALALESSIECETLI